MVLLYVVVRLLYVSLADYDFLFIAFIKIIKAYCFHALFMMLVCGVRLFDSTVRLHFARQWNPAHFQSTLDDLWQARILFGTCTIEHGSASVSPLESRLSDLACSTLCDKRYKSMIAL